MDSVTMVMVRAEADPQAAGCGECVLGADPMRPLSSRRRQLVSCKRPPPLDEGIRSDAHDVTLQREADTSALPIHRVVEAVRWLMRVIVPPARSVASLQRKSLRCGNGTAEAQLVTAGLARRLALAVRPRHSSFHSRLVG